MSVFIKLDLDDWCQGEIDGIDYENGYHEMSSLNDHAYKQISDKFTLVAVFHQLISSNPYTMIFAIKTSNFVMSFTFRTDYVICEMFDSSDGYKNILCQRSNSKINLREINGIVDQYQTIQSNLPSLGDIMSFLDLIPDSENVRLIKDLFMGENENENENDRNICDWKSGLELMIDYTSSSKPLILPMVII